MGKVQPGGDDTQHCRGGAAGNTCHEYWPEDRTDVFELVGMQLVGMLKRAVKEHPVVFVV